MKKLYILSLIGLMGIVHASQDQQNGKLPEGFVFKKCAEDDEECLNQRVSFMSQFKKHTQPKITIGNSRVVIINSDIDMIVSEDTVNNEIIIKFTKVNKKD